MDYVLAALSLGATIAAAAAAIASVRIATAFENRRVRRYKVGLLVRCAKVGVGPDDLKEAYVAFLGSKAVEDALQELQEGLELRRKTQPIRQKTGSDILGIIKQKAIDQLTEALIEAMCKEVGVSCDVVSLISGFTNEQLTRWKYKSNLRA